MIIKQLGIRLHIAPLLTKCVRSLVLCLVVEGIHTHAHF